MERFTPFWEEKAWGRVQHLFADSESAISHLHVLACTRCSKHRHADRVNLFAVFSGAIMVEVWPKLELPPLRHVLRQGQTQTVPNGVWHRFRVLQAGMVGELYWSGNGNPVRLDDIERLDEGGPDDLSDLDEAFACCRGTATIR